MTMCLRLMGYLNSSGYYAWFSFVNSLPLNSEFGTSEFDILSAKTCHAHPPSCPQTHHALSGKGNSAGGCTVQCFI